MKRKYVFTALLLCATLWAVAQKKDAVLLTVNSTPVYASEFKKVYKKNLDLVQDESQKDVENYLGLFIDYKLKVAEAYAQKLDEKPAYKKEFSKYQDQLSRKYLYDQKLAAQLAKEAFERGKEQINANHILITINGNETPADTLAAHKLLKTIRQKAVNGEDFVALAKQHSQEPGAKERGGALGWFSAFSMVYPFEQAAYNTPVGEISNVVRTRFGYHILKVNARRPRGAPVAVSHIMVTDNTGERTFKPEERINEVYNLLQQGSRFEDLAKQYSDDKNSARNGGKLRTFARGELRSEIFVNKAYENPTPGAISKPFRSEFGWHIIRFEEQLPQPTYEEKEAELLDRVKQGQRLNIINTAVTNKIKEKYGYTEGATIEPFYSTYVTGAIVKKTWRADTLSPTKNKTLFTIGDKTVTYNDFAFYLQKYQRTKRFAKKNQYIREGYDSFKDEVLKDYFKKKLEEDNKAYAAVINEYRDGLLIFDVMNINVWNRAKQDSVGLQKYYGTVKHNHMWKKRFKGITVSATNKAHAAQAAALLKENKTAGTIKKTLNTNGKTNVVVSEGTFEAGNHRVIPAAFQFKEGVSPVMPTENGYTVVKAEKIMPPTVKTLNEVRGKIMSGHQKKTEKEWVAGLRKKHTVKVNKRTLKKVIKTLE